MSKDWRSQAHVKWDCTYHVVILPKYRKKVLFGKLRKQIGAILRDLCRQREVELVEGNCPVCGNYFAAPAEEQFCSWA